MAVQLIGNIHNFQGESSDTKPTEAPVGSTFLELDTGAKFIWNGYVWEDDLELIYALSQVIDY